MTTNDPLTEVEKQIILDAGWKFASPEYIYVPNDEDGCMAYGIGMIRKVLQSIIDRKSLS